MEDAYGTLCIALSRRTVEALALARHEFNYKKRGDRYATPEEMQMHRDDPCACWDMVKDDIERFLDAQLYHWTTDEFFFSPNGPEVSDI